MRTSRQFSWTASTPLAWSWPTLTAAPTPTVDPPIVVGQTVWIITDDGRVMQGRVLGDRYLIPETSIANIPRP